MIIRTLLLWIKKGGFLSRKYKQPADTSEIRLLEIIAELNQDKLIHGILVQLPLPKNISTDKIITAIDPHKDVDGFHPYNVGGLVTGSPLFVPCTPRGIMVLITRTAIDCGRPQQYCRETNSFVTFGPTCHCYYLSLTDKGFTLCYAPG